MQGLSTEDIAHVRNSFDRLWPISTRIAELFYGRLFEIAPEVRPLFRHDMDELKQKFMSTLAVIVGTLDDTSKLAPLTDSLAKQHVGYGVRVAHYDIVGQALIWTLQQGLGASWTPSVAESWTRAYGAVSSSMIRHTPSA